MRILETKAPNIFRLDGKNSLIKKELNPVIDWLEESLDDHRDYTTLDISEANNDNSFTELKNSEWLIHFLFLNDEAATAFKLRWL